MTNTVKKSSISPTTREQALKFTIANQRLGQSKEHTRLVTRGIEKGIEQFKKQQKAKVRELDKKLKKQRNNIKNNSNKENSEVPKYKYKWLPWILLLLTWAGIAQQLLVY